MTEGSKTHGAQLRVAALNLRAYFTGGREGAGDLPRLIADQDADVVLLQECRQPWFDTICDAAGLTGVHSHDVKPPLELKPPDGCAIAVRAPFAISRAWRLGPERFQPAVVAEAIDEMTPEGHEQMPDNLAGRYAARNVFAEIELGDARFVAAALHATPGSTDVRKGLTVHEWKPFFHGSVALELERLSLPFVFAIDANEPLAETADSVTFHWAEDRSGFRKLDALLGLSPRHPGRDLLRESLAASGRAPIAADYLELTHELRGGAGRRFDSIWATPEFALDELTTHFEEARTAGTDHALLVADLRLDP